MALNPGSRMDPQTAAERAVSVIGLGYDLTSDIRLTACKPGPGGLGLIEIDQKSTKDLVVPGGVVVSNVSTSIKCDKGERTRFRSDALSFSQMSEQMNQELSLSGKIPSGLFNAMFGHKGCWQKDAASTKLLGFDGWFITLYNIELVRSHLTLSEQVKQDVPSSWDPPALAEFIEKYGTHIVVGVKMGGKDVIHIKQLQNSILQPVEVQKLLKQLGDEKFSEDINGCQIANPVRSSEKSKVDSGNRPVTGIRLYLEGKRSDHLAIHLQHLSALPQSIKLTDDLSYEPVDEPVERGYLEPVKWSIFSHVCTAPVEYRGTRIDDSASIVTKAWFEVKVIGMKKVLFLRLGFSMVASAKIRRSEWEGPATTSRKSGLISMLITTPFSTKLNQPQKQAKVDLNSAVYPGGPPSPAKAPKMSHFVDTTEMVRGPEESPGYWVVTGAKLCVEDSRIRIKVKYSLLTILTEESLLI